MATGLLLLVTPQGEAILKLDNDWYGITQMIINIDASAFKKHDKVQFDVVGGRKSPRLKAHPIMMKE